MAVDQTSVDLLSLDDFGHHLDARLREARAALTALTTGPGADRPPLGDFDDANVTAERYEAMRVVYVARLQRLIDALIAAEETTGTIATSYLTLETRNAADTERIGAELRPGA
jgi:hypothetical protein